MREELDLGTLSVLDRRPVPQRAELLAPSMVMRVGWAAAALACAVFVWSVALAAGWLRASGWAVAVVGGPRGLEHLMWMVPVALGVVCVAMAVSGVRLEIDAGHLAVTGLWPRPMRRRYELSRLSYVSFDRGVAAPGDVVYRMRFVFDEAEVVARCRDRLVWEALRARFRDRAR